MKTAAEPVARPSTDCPYTVRAARGHETKHGVAFSGTLWKGDQQIAQFRNSGNGGCNVWTVISASLFADFETFAKARCPDDTFEQADLVVGELWDKAFLSQS